MFYSSLSGKFVLSGCLLLLCSALVSCVPSIPTPSSSNEQQSSEPRLIPATCPMSLPEQYIEGKNIECSYLLVKENRADPNSRDLLLAVARVKSSDPHPAPDPLIMLQGGPGGGVLSELDFFASAAGIKKESGKRDLILIDQRGTGYSAPPMKCNEEFAVQDAQIEQNIPTAKALQQGDEAVKECRTRLSSQLHIDLNEYTSLTNANDIHDLITALKVPQADLYGVSYGTRLALEVMRSFPQQVRSVILDSTVPSQTNIFEDDPNVVARVYRTMFDDCAAEPTCAKAHPQLEQRFWTFVAKAQKTPVIMPIQDPNTQKMYNKAVVNGTSFEQTFWEFFYITSLIPNIPSIMEQVMQGDTKKFALYYGFLNLDHSVNTGMYRSVECNENETRFSSAHLEANIKQLDPSVQQDNTLSAEDLALAQCKIWNVKPEATDLAQPVKSSIPTLIMEGKYDPITPPAYGMAAAKTLVKSYQFLAPSTGHGVYLSGQACPVQVGEAFLQNPAQAPDTSCAQKMPARPDFQ